MRGFTLIELLVVTSIIVILSALILPNYRGGDQQLSLQRTAHKLTQDLRRAQEMALSSQQFQGEAPEAYGIYFDKNQPQKYILFADLDSDGQYSGLNEKVEEITLEGRISINDLSPEVLSVLNIVFAPPEPNVSFYPDAVTASISLGTEAVVSGPAEYNYYYIRTLNDWVQPRADCDANPQTENCPDSFSATALGDLLVHDWFGQPPDKQSKEYEKQEGGESLPSSKTVRVNKAGLIYVE